MWMFLPAAPQANRALQGGLFIGVTMGRRNLHLEASTDRSLAPQGQWNGSDLRRN